MHTHPHTPIDNNCSYLSVEECILILGGLETFRIWGLPWVLCMGELKTAWGIRKVVMDIESRAHLTHNVAHRHTLKKKNRLKWLIGVIK